MAQFGLTENILSSNEDESDTNCKDEIENCKEFFSNFLDPLSLDLRMESIQLMHNLTKRNGENSKSKEQCSSLVTRIEKELGSQHIVCQAVTKELVDCLRKLELVDDAAALINERLERMEKEDFGTILILGMLRDYSGDYSTGLGSRKKLLEIAEDMDDPVLLCLANAKLACSLWHLQKPEEARQTHDVAKMKIDDCDFQMSQTDFPFSETTLRLLDVYKTIAYLDRTMNSDNRQGSTKYLTKALEIVQKDKLALVQAFKLQTQIGCDYAYSTYKEPAKDYCQEAYDSIIKVLANHKFMLHHSDTVIHALARVAHTFQMTYYKEECLAIRDDLYRVAIKYLDSDHPEVARVAADAAYLSNEIKNFRQEELYIERAETRLEECGYKEDISKTKLYVRELSDAYKTLGMLYTKRNDCSRAEKSYQEAVRINTLVYGSDHVRVARIYRSFAFLYKKWNKFPQALELFQKCKDINLKYNPENTILQAKLQKEMGHVIQLQKRSRRY